ncbi:GNAT family N-acetyltransferase [Blastomonas sp.]|uniref:GNAT family N-acetyltransferase n=1 Tax=Blastomonas sp. TaxID=1909299 RepID=UPI002626D8CC|nr:GNAT family N-acetyltransferase [Blastomonas sp.]MDM7957700.1 GNAT family N-acetyltransferase [Blastomonas sp.]
MTQTHADTASAITHETTSSGGRFLYQAQGAQAELTYANASASSGATRVVADHTYVPDSMRGQGIAARLVDALIAKARADHWTIVPRCSYVVTAFKRHPEWSDVLAD